MFFSEFKLINYDFIVMLLTDDEQRQDYLSRHIKVSKKISNEEFRYMIYFFDLTKIVPTNVIICKDFSPFIFFFVNRNDYKEAKGYKNKLRSDLHKKLLIIQTERKFKDLICSLFPDLTIKEFNLIMFNKDLIHIELLFQTFEERGIAIGRNGDYIKTINLILNEFISVSCFTNTIKLECKVA